jgi:hypothetical protein
MDQSTSNGCSNFISSASIRKEAGVQVRFGRCFLSHLHLHGRNGDASDAGAVIFSQIKAATAKAATNVQNARPAFYVSDLPEMFDELDLRFLWTRRHGSSSHGVDVRPILCCSKD